MSRRKKSKGEKVGERTGQVVGGVGGAYATGGVGAGAGAEVGKEVGGTVGKEAEKRIKKRNPISPLQYEGMIRHVAKDIDMAIKWGEMEDIRDIDVSPDEYVWSMMSLDADKYISDTIFKYLQGFSSDTELGKYYYTYNMYIEILSYSNSSPAILFKIPDGEGLDYLQDMAYQVVVKDVVKFLR